MGTLGRPMTSVLEDTLRAALLKEVGRFVERARHLAGVERIALIGSLTTPKEHPKDADVLTTISNDVDLAALATVARKLKGAGQRRNSGADVFLCNKAGDYLGRTCFYRECHPRMACRGRQCAFSSYLCDDLDEVCLEKRLIVNPPIVLWPEVVPGREVPEDVERLLLAKLRDLEP